MAALLLSSCVKDELYNTPHPDKGAVTISLTGLSADDNYVLDIDGKTADITGSPFVYPDLLLPGAHSLVLYNRAEGFTFDERMAYVNTRDDKTRADGTPIIPLPGYLKTVSQEITVTADDTLRVSPVPQQRVRDLHIEFTVTQGRPELIQTVTGTLSGIAGIFDMEKGQTTGEPTSTVFSFIRDDGNYADLGARHRLRGRWAYPADGSRFDGSPCGLQRRHDHRLLCDRHAGNACRHGGRQGRDYRMGTSGRRRCQCGNVTETMQFNN